MLPLVSHGANLFNLCPFPDSPALYVQNLFPVGPAVWPHFPGFWIVNPLTPPPMPPWGSWGELFLAYVHSHMNPQTCSECCANQSIRLAAFPDLSLWPPKPPGMPPVLLRGELYLAMSIPRRIRRHVPKVCANRSSRLTASPDIWICDPLNPPQMPPGILWATCI